MAKSETPEGLVKKEFLYLAVLIALVAGFLGGVIFSSYRSPAGFAPQAANSDNGDQGQTGINPDQANKIMALEKEVATHPDNGEAWTGLGNVYFDTGQFAKAITSYQKALAINSEQPEVWTDLGVMYRRNRQPQEAIKAFDRAISLKPTLQQARFNKGIVLLYDLHDKAGAIKAWQEELAIDPNAKAPNGQPLQEVIDATK